MTKNTATSISAPLANEVGYDPIEDRLRLNIRATIEAVFEEELEQFLGRCRYRRGETAAMGYRHPARLASRDAPRSGPDGVGNPVAALG